jgi:hypothetical protein
MTERRPSLVTDTPRSAGSTNGSVVWNATPRQAVARSGDSCITGLDALVRKTWRRPRGPRLCWPLPTSSGRVTPPHGSAGSSLTDLEDLLVLTTDAVN